MSKPDLYKYKSKLKISKIEGKTRIYDPIRKKYLILQPEELVRQLYLQYLINEIGLSPKLIQVEKQIKVGDLVKRYDLICYNNHHKPHVLVECKSYNISLDEKVFSQISIYNLALKIPYLVVTNGESVINFKIDFTSKDYKIIDQIDWNI